MRPQDQPEMDLLEELHFASNGALPATGQLFDRAAAEIVRLRAERGDYDLRCHSELQRLRDVIENSAQLAEKYGTPEARHIADELRDLKMVHPVHRWTIEPKPLLAATIEECARVADSFVGEHGDDSTITAEEIADAIRALNPTVTP